MQEHHLRFKIGTVVLGLLAFAGAGLYFAVDSGRSSHEIERLREQNRVLNAHLKDLESRFDTIKSYTASVRALAGAEMTPTKIKEQDELQLLVQSPESLGLFGRVSLAAKAAPGAEDAGLLRSDVERFSDMLMTIDGLSRDTEGLLRRLRALSTILRHNESLASSIPSLKPTNGKITSEFGMRLSPFDGARQLHAGIDIAAAPGSPIKAPADGIVTFVGDFDSLGNAIVIKHDSGIMTRYGHTQRVHVRVGQAVKRGAVIGTVGNTGKSTGPHLHYEVWVKNQAVNPRDFFFDLTEKAPLISRDGKPGKGNRPMGGGSGL